MSGTYMYKSFFCILLISFFLASAGCGANPYKPVAGLPRDLTPSESNLIESDNVFGLKLFREIAGSQADGNMFISPLSVSMALGMTYNGAAGETEAAMRNTLGLGGMTLAEINESYQSLIELLSGLDPGVIFQIANSIWHEGTMDFEQEFIELNKTYFNAEVAGLDFGDPGSVDIINDWVDTSTNGKIDKILDSIPIGVVMYLINAIYFKGTWTSEFDKSDTRDDLFDTGGGSQAPCKMMVRTARYKYMENDDLQAVDLPYGEGEYSMTVLLPRPGKDINLLIDELNSANWSIWTGSLAETKVKLELPKFTLEYEMTLNEVLKALGMEIAFDPVEADFSRMWAGVSPDQNLYISNVKHKTFVEVNEEGTEAAAVTSVEISLTSISDDIVMRVDRPFVFVIRENYSGTILFMGRITQPTLPS
ncbi:serpin family protein [candidate division KSB1 bacterium]